MLIRSSRCLGLAWMTTFSKSSPTLAPGVFVDPKSKYQENDDRCDGILIVVFDARRRGANGG